MDPHGADEAGAKGTAATQALKLEVRGAGPVSALLEAPAGASACYVFAHGAGAGMRHAFMESVAAGLSQRGIASLRFQFPYMEQGSKRPDSPKVAHAAVRAAVAEAARRMPATPLFAGGKSFGGRMVSQAQALEPLPGVRGLVFLGFPLHPAGKPSVERAAHLGAVQIPMLFLQGGRDALAQPALLEPVVAKLGERATLRVFAQADHSFHVPARSGTDDARVMEEVLEAMAQWFATRASTTVSSGSGPAAPSGRRGSS